MTSEVLRHNRPISDHLHPFVYKAAAGLVLCFVVGAWVFFGSWAYMGLLLAVVSGFFLMAVAIPFALWLAWRKHRGSDPARAESISLREWTSGEFVSWQDRRKGANANAAVEILLPIAVEILLPIAGLAVGMVALGSVFYFVSLWAG